MIFVKDMMGNQLEKLIFYIRGFAILINNCTFALPLLGMECLI
jgi:hypothetical protein